MRIYSWITLLPLWIAGLLIADCSMVIARPPHHASHSGISADDRKQARRRRDEMKAKLHSLHSRMSDTRAKIHQQKAKEVHITESIGTVEGRMEQTKQHLTRVNTRLETLDAEHDKVVQRLEQTQSRLKERKQILAQRLRDNYRRKQATYSQTLLQSRTLHELLSRAYYVRLIVQSDADLIESIQLDVKQIRVDKKLVEVQEREQERLAAELEDQKKQYVADLSLKRTILIGVKAERVTAEQELDDLESDANAMTDRIRALSEMLRRQQEEAERARRAAAKHNGKGSKGGRESRYTPPVVWRGGFIRPCSGPITSGFGMRFHPILHRTRMHTGVDFGAGYGAPIHAAAGGIVLLSAYTSGYGNCVIIDHGGGVTTLYGHCSARLVREGESVRQGQLIGRVGATGLATGPHLHFEVRHNGVPVPPY